MRTRKLFACALLVSAPAWGAAGTETPPAPAPHSSDRVQWKPLIEQSLYFLGIQHAFRLATEPGTRSGARGSYWKGYARSVSNLHGWGDGDPFYVNYVGHPLQGSFSGYLWTQNDPKYWHVEFGKNRDYWQSRLRATAFSWAYSTQFELGPLSEASVGQIQSRFPQQGFVDHVVTPAVGLGWMVAEDALDKYVVKRLEAHITNNWARLFLRSGLNPARSGANALRGKPPWHRDNRAGVRAYQPGLTAAAATPSVDRPADTPGAAPFEVEFHGLASSYDGRACTGGGASAALRVASDWQLVFDATGCKIAELRAPVSADSITYLFGPRWRPASRGRFNPHAHFLVGGQKVSKETLDVEREKILKALAQRPGGRPPLREQYAEFETRKGFSLMAGAGLEVKLHPAIALRLASVDWVHTWMAPVDGHDYSSQLRVTWGLVLRMGTW